MAKVRILGDAGVITSSHKLEDIKKLQKYNPEALKLRKENGNGEKVAVFAIGVGDTPHCSQYGITFATAERDGSGKASLTFVIPADVEEVKEWVEEEFGRALNYLNEIEAGLNTAIEKVNAERAKVRECISVVTA